MKIGQKSYMQASWTFLTLNCLNFGSCIFISAHNAHAVTVPSLTAYLLFIEGIFFLLKVYQFIIIQQFLTCGVNTIREPYLFNVSLSPCLSLFLNFTGYNCHCNNVKKLTVMQDLYDQCCLSPNCCTVKHIVTRIP